MNYTHSRWPLVVVIAGLLCAGALRVPLGAATQAAPPAARIDRGSLQDRLNGIRPVVLSGGDIQAAIRELHAILAVDPKAAEAHLLLGLAYGQLDSQEMDAEAIAELRQALAIEPGLVPARVALARLYLEFGQPERAREEADAALKAMPAHPQILALLGEAERQLGRPTRAVDIQRRALASNPAFEQARYYLGLALLDAGRRDQGIAELERLVEAGASLPDVYFTLGSTYLDAGRTDEALRTLEQGTRFGTPEPEVRLRLARAYRLKGMLGRAETEIASALPAGAAMQASTVHQQLQAEVDVELGLIRLQQGQLDAAVQAFQKALRIKSDHGPAHQQLAEVLLRQGRHREAAEHARRAAALGSPLPGDRREALDRALGR